MFLKEKGFCINLKIKTLRFLMQKLSLASFF